MLPIAEDPNFTKDAERHLEPDELITLYTDLATNPEAGDLIPDTGGFRKLRIGLKRQAKGKRGGARIIYYYYNEGYPLYLVALYAKGEKITLSAAEKRELREISKNFPTDYDRMKVKTAAG